MNETFFLKKIEARRFIRKLFPLTTIERQSKFKKFLEKPIA